MIQLLYCLRQQGLGDGGDQIVGLGFVGVPGGLPGGLLLKLSQLAGFRGHGFGDDRFCGHGFRNDGFLGRFHLLLAGTLHIGLQEGLPGGGDLDSGHIQLVVLTIYSGHVHGSHLNGGLGSQIALPVEGNGEIMVALVQGGGGGAEIHKVPVRKAFSGDPLR